MNEENKVRKKISGQQLLADAWLIYGSENIVFAGVWLGNYHYYTTALLKP